MQKNLVKKAASIMISPLRKKSVSYKNFTLPPKHLRFCGNQFKDDDFYFSSACKEAERLEKNCGLNANSQILDVGCGPGRLAIGILGHLGTIKEYKGVDVDKKSIDWCQKFITSKNPKFQFIHLDVMNLRYNPNGKNLRDDFILPFSDGEFDVINLYSVFTHMTEEDVRIYLKELHRVIKTTGKIFLTAFLEENVENVTVNPKETDMEWKGPLHCVRFEKSHFMKLVDECGFSIDRFVHGEETHGQSALYISHRK